MTPTTAPAHRTREPADRTDPRAEAERAAAQRLLNSYLRESGTPLPAEGGDGALVARIALPVADASLVVPVVHRSVFGHHAYGAPVRLEPSHGPSSPVRLDELVRLVLNEVEAIAARVFGPVPDADDRKRALAEQIQGSVDATARYLEHHRDTGAPVPDDPTRAAEQSVLLGHPFHPTPKSIQGFGDDLASYAPELGASFVPHWFAVDRRILLERRTGPGPWTPGPVAAAAREALGDRAPVGAPSPGADPALVPVHPWQARHLASRPEAARLTADGLLTDLGPLGAPVYPTSSVRTVCDPRFPTSWKLPLHVRITNFVRTNPVPHLVRAADAAAVVGALAPEWDHPGFAALAETGFRTLDPGAVGDGLAADLGVLYRDNPFTVGRQAPQVLASLLEERDGEEPGIVREVRRCSPDPGARPGAEHTADWLRRYLAVSLVPLLEVFERDGVAFEAHAQNALLVTDGGRPEAFRVRDMEGTAVSRGRLRSGTGLPPDSPLLYGEDEAWLRLRYYAVTNQLGHVVAVLGRHTGADERALWHTVRSVLADRPGPRAADLLSHPSLPAKANLVSRFAGRGEDPLYVDVPNPLFEVNR
ncbi:IucA/IucC family protein [Nocardiopsis chromatogenes]|uniref:IucA/IucC family protein n=1 Tax=Nocardiopsis chromatogenes TaxID=280239 RepID=UPI0003474299|nr:IucA/IucC family protein [Nocardiopsis chromatogenes]